MVGRLKSGALLLAGLVLAGALAGLLPAEAGAQGESKRLFTIKVGTQDTGGDQLIEDFEQDHGPTGEGRERTLSGFELEFISLFGQSTGIGLSIEARREAVQHYDFSDSSGQLPSSMLELYGRGILYTLKFYGRKGPFWAFAGVGSGNYFLTYTEQSSEMAEEIEYFDAAPRVFHWRVGVHLLSDSWGLLLEHGEVTAPVTIRTRENDPELELGGEYNSIGLSWQF